MFFNTLMTNIRTNVPLNMDAVNKEMASFEWRWTNQHQSFSDVPQGDPLKVVIEIREKYRPLFDISND